MLDLNSKEFSSSHRQSVESSVEFSDWVRICAFGR